MNFRRQPFQFASIDPVKRHAELQKRFGLPSDEMYLDGVNSGVMGAGEKGSLMNSSPRLQHRVPVFSQGVQPTKLAGIQNNVDNGHQPRVRVIPIQVEGVNDTSKRHRTFSGPAGSVKSNNVRERSPGQRFEAQPKPVNADQPRVCNIPINMESSNTGKEKESKRKETVIPTVIERKEQTPVGSSNGCTVSKTRDPSIDSLKQIEEVLNKLKRYQVEVEKFTGTNKDKQYRYLDEMLTRCMLDLDNVDTLGMDNVRQSRKNAVKQVQACVDLLETKVTTQSTVAETSTESVPPSEIESINTDASVTQLDVQKDGMVADTEMKECDGENADVEMEKENSVEDAATFSDLRQACDIEMEDKTLEDQSAKIVVEEPGENLTEVETANIEEMSSENQNSEFVAKMSEDAKSSNNERVILAENSPNGERITIEEVVDNSEGRNSELVIEEMCSDNEKSLDLETPVATEINMEPIVTEHDSNELPELSNNTSDEQISTSSSNKCDQSKDIKDEEISITEIPNKTDIIVEECN